MCRERERLPAGCGYFWRPWSWGPTQGPGFLALGPPSRAHSQAFPNPLFTTAHWGLEYKVSHAPGSGPAFCLLPVPGPISWVPWERGKEACSRQPPPPPQPLCHLLDHCPCSFSGKRLVAWVKGSGLAALSGCSLGSLRLVRLWRGLESWVTSDFPPLSTPSWIPNPLITHRQSIHPFTSHRHLSHTITSRHGIPSHTWQKTQCHPTQTPFMAPHKYTSHNRSLVSDDSAVPRGMCIITHRTKPILTDTQNVQQHWLT